MVKRICKICRKSFNFTGGTIFCSDRCQNEWPELRSRMYQVLVKPARDATEGLKAKSFAAKAAKVEQKRVMKLYEEFLESPDPYAFVLANPELDRKLRGERLD